MLVPKVREQPPERKCKSRNKRCTRKQEIQELGDGETLVAGKAKVAEEDVRRILEVNRKAKSNLRRGESALELEKEVLGVNLSNRTREYCQFLIQHHKEGSMRQVTGLVAL